MFFLRSDSQEDVGQESGDEEGARTDYVVSGHKLGEYETSMFDARRYLGINPNEFKQLTPREFSVLMAAETEHIYDKYDLMATEAMMMRAAYHKEKLRKKDLFKRPGDVKTEKTADDVRQRQKALESKLSKFAEFNGKF